MNRIGIYGVIVFASLLGSSFAVAAKEPSKIPVVFTQKIVPTEIADQLTYPAKVESQINAKVISESDGVVLKIMAPLGSRVVRSGGLMVIKNMESGYQYAPFTLRSAVAGIVSQVKVTVGSQVARGQEVAVVTDPAQLRVTLEVSSPDIASLSLGTAGEFTGAGVTEPVPVKVAGVSPLIDPATGTATAELKIVSNKQAKSSVQPGQIGQVHFKVNARKGMVLPDHAIVYRGNETFARLVIDGKSKSAKVKLGPKRRGMIEVLEGLKAGDVVIERASQYIADGDPVEIQESDKRSGVN